MSDVQARVQRSELEEMSDRMSQVLDDAWQATVESSPDDFKRAMGLWGHYLVKFWTYTHADK